MKKILLSLFLLTYFNFYSQVANEVHCAGETTFNLTNHNSLLIGNLNPVETIVSYHLTSGDAINGANAISNPTNFIVPQNQGILVSQTIYARINHLGNITTNYFSLIVNPPFLAPAIIDPIDCMKNGTIRLQVLGGQAPLMCNINNTFYSTSDGNTANFSYFPTGNMSTITFSNLVAGTYNILLRDAIGCTAYGSWTIEPSSIIPLDTPTATIINATCKGSNNGAININATGGKAPFWYSIDNGVNYVSSNAFTNLVAGTYNITVKDANNCTSSMIATVTEPNLLSTTAAITKPLDCISNASITVTATGGTAPYTYSKDGIAFVQNTVFDNLVAGTYTTYVKDANGCISQNSILIFPLVQLSATITKTDVLCSGNNNGSITINTSGGKAPYVYSLDNGMNYVSSNAFTNLVAGTYNITVKDANNCTSSMIATVTEPNLLLTTVAITKNIDCISNASITVTATGGTAPYTYSKDGITFVQSNIFDNLVAGTYTTYVKDANDCISSNSITINPLTSLSISSTVINPNCKENNDGSITISTMGGQAPYNYSLDNGVNFVSSNTFTNLVAGTYNIIVRDANNCTSSMIATVTEPTLLSTTATITKTIDCISNAKVTVTAAGGTSPYTYSKDGITFVQSNVFDNLVAGTYTSYIKDANGCISSNSITINPLTPLSISSIVLNTRCKGNNDGSITITATGGNSPYTYSLDNGVNFVSSNTFTNLVAGTYNITVKDASNCTSSMIATVTEPNLLLTTVAITKTIDCISNASVTVTATGGTAPYTYSKDGSTFVQSNVFENLVTGSYTTYVKDANGCISSNSISINPLTSLSISSTVINPNCKGNNDGSITISTMGGQAPYNYSIDGTTYVSSNAFTNLVPGTYNIIVKDANNCTSSMIVTIVEPSLLSITAAITKPIDCVSNAIVTLTATGGVSPYTYSKDGITFVQSNVIDNLVAGIHTTYVKDTNGCISQNSTVISPSVSLSATITKADVLCNGNNDGSITINTTGGQDPYFYSLDNGLTYVSSNSFNNLSAGYYNVSVKDALGCLYTMVAAIIEPTILSMTAVTTNSTTSDDNDGTITVNTTGGVAPYTYAVTDNFGLPIIPSQTSNFFMGLKAGLYGVRVTDAKGCFYLQTNIVINKPNPLLATIAVTPTTCLNSTGTITISVSGGAGPYQYSLDNGATYVSSNVFTNLVPGNYSITVRDTENTTTVPATIADIKPVLITATLLSAVSCNGANNGSIKTTIIQAQAPYVYKLDNVDFYDSNAEYTFNNLHAGEHTIQVIDNNGCTSFVSITIPEPTILNSTVALNDKTISINTTGGVPPYSYTLQDNDTGATITGPQTSNVFTNLPTGVYSVQVIDSTICSLLKTGINISNTNVFSASFSVSPITCNNPSGMITVVATGGSGSYEYSLDNGINYTTSNVFTGLAPGTYNINVKDSQNTTTTVIATISPLQPLVADAVLTKTIDCLSNASINVIASGGKKPYQYSFDNGLTYNANNTFTNINAGTYFVQVKDSFDCTVTTNNIVIVQPIPLYANFTTADGTITTNATGGIAPYSYVLTDNNGLPTTPFQNSNIFTGLTNGSYGVEVRDATGCTYIKTDITIVNKPNSLLATTTVTPTTCLNPTGTITVSVSGGVTPYQYSIDNGVNYISTNVFTSLTPGTYMIKVRDAENNITSIVAAITPVNAPAISANVNSNVLCKGDNTGSITAVATGGQAPYTYSLDGITFNTTSAFTNLRVGTYNISVKDANGCISTTTIALTEPAENLSATAILINDQGIIVNAKGGTAPYKYYLQNNNGIVVAGPQTDGIFTRLPIGRYSAQVTDANGCGYIHWSVDVVQAPPLSATVQVDSIKCNATGTITVNATGGFQPYYYSFDNGATYTNSNVYSSFKPGTYAIKVRDYQNTIFSITAVITQGSVPVINAAINNITCKGEANGSITTNVTGGLVPYTYSLDNGPYINGSSNMAFSNLHAGTHLITVKDTNGCLTTTQVAISEPASALMTVTTVKSQTITINASGGTGNYRYAISPNLDNSSTNNVFSGLTPGSYIVNTSDVNGCYITMNALVDPPAPLINGQIKLTLEFKPGQTLADLIIDGQNIKWYINQNPLAGKTSRTSEIPLPLTTVIVEGTTYYASQTINGIESIERMAVTVKSSTLGTNDLIIKNFEYYPNPVKNVLTISNTSIIDEVAFISIKGETLLTKKINGLRSEIDLSNFSKGVYFLKIKSEGAEKTVKLIKE